MYILVPYRNVELRHAASGALLAGIAFEVAKRAFAVYLVITTERNRAPGRELTEALDVLGVLARAQDAGQVLPLTRVAARARVMPHRCELALERCAGLDWVAKTEKDGWVLSRDADTIRVADVYRAFVLDPGLTGERLAEHWKHIDVSLGETLRQISEKEHA